MFVCSKRYYVAAEQQKQSITRALAVFHSTSHLLLVFFSFCNAKYKFTIIALQWHTDKRILTHNSDPSSFSLSPSLSHDINKRQQHNRFNFHSKLHPLISVCVCVYVLAPHPNLSASRVAFIDPSERLSNMIPMTRKTHSLLINTHYVVAAEIYPRWHLLMFSPSTDLSVSICLRRRRQAATDYSMLWMVCV